MMLIAAFFVTLQKVKYLLARDRDESSGDYHMCQSDSDDGMRLGLVSFSSAFSRLLKLTPEAPLFVSTKLRTRRCARNSKAIEGNRQTIDFR